MTQGYGIVIANGTTGATIEESDLTRLSGLDPDFKILDNGTSTKLIKNRVKDTNYSSSGTSSERPHLMSYDT